MKTVATLLAVLMLAGLAGGASALSQRWSYQAASPSLWEAIDGDTIRSPAGVKYRLDGMDAPETFQARSECERKLGEAAKAELERLLASGIVEVRELTKKSRKTGEIVAKQDRYGRTLAKVFIGGRDVAELMIQGGFARPYSGGKRQPWCQS